MSTVAPKSAPISDTIAASYERVSTRAQGQTGFSLGAQAKDAAAYAADQGWQLPDQLRFRDGEDRHASGADWDLPGLNAMLDGANRLVRVIVADNGPGIPTADREKLFLPYYSTKRRGSGLGLAIVRRIIAEHGGTIEVSANVPKGTRFTIELPC